MIIEPITLREANRMLAGAHYLGALTNGRRFALSTPERDALAVYRTPTAPSFKRACPDSLELKRLWAAPGYGGEPIIDRKGFKRAGRSLSQFLAASLKWLRREAPKTEAVFSFADQSERNSETRRLQYGGIYRASNFYYLGPSQRMPHWIDEDGKRVSTKVARARHGTRDMQRIAALEPSWRLVRGEPKLVCAYPLAMSIEQVCERIAANAPSGSIHGAVLPWPEPWD
jgi:hypothetical protein